MQHLELAGAIVVARARVGAEVLAGGGTGTGATAGATA